MENFKITSVPQGDAPQWVREAMVGLELPKHSGETLSGWSVTNLCGEGVTPDTGYSVVSKIVIGKLMAKNPEAAWWFIEKHPNIISERLLVPA